MSLEMLITVLDFILKYLIIPVGALTLKLWFNEVRHLEKRLDELHEWCRDIEKKLDTHIMEHPRD